MTPAQFLDKMRSWRLRGRVICPAVRPGTYTPYPVTYAYGVKSDRYAAGHHTGEDHACPSGSLAVAVSWGQVIATGPGVWGPAYGNQVVIRTANGKYDYAYCHLSRIFARPGDRVQPGGVVGVTGATGNVTGPHLHFEARPAGGRYGSDVNPIRVKQRVPRKASK